jgi:hypothetical protein
VIILPYWGGGRVSRAYGAKNTGRRVAPIVVVYGDSNVAVSSYQGERPVEPVLEAPGNP